MNHPAPTHDCDYHLVIRPGDHATPPEVLTTSLVERLLRMYGWHVVSLHKIHRERRPPPGPDEGAD